jgi:histidine ammonia-lyase
MPITLDGSSLTIEKLVAIARDNEKVELAPEALQRIKACRAMLEEKLAAKEVMYGTNTGIGEFSETMLNDEQVKEFQKYLIYNVMLRTLCAKYWLLCLNLRILSMPASIQSIPAAADQEDFVSMGLNTAIKNGQILDNAYGVLGIEFMAAAQALDFRDFTPGKGTNKAREVIRKYVAHLDIDRPLYNDHNTMKELVKSGEILEEVEKAVGRLG